MNIPGITLIAEAINDSIPSTHELFAANDFDAIVKLAKYQAEMGADYIDVNIGVRPPAVMADLIRRIQKEVSLPLAIDTPDAEIAAAALEVYDINCSQGKKPILNSISEARLEMFDLYRIHPFVPILLISEGLNDDGMMVMNKTAEQTLKTAKSVVQRARDRLAPIDNEQLILDPGIAPIGSDTEGNFPRLIEAIKLIHEENDLKGIHISVGLSNFTNMLPAKKSDGTPIKASLENAFLTIAMPLGLDTIIGSVKRNYTLLPEEHPAVICLKDILKIKGVDAILRIMSFIS